MTDHGEVPHDRFNFGVAGSEELREIPLATGLAVIGEDGAEGIAASETFPGVLQIVECAHRRLRLSAGQQNARHEPGA